jgi:hypothetical protein
VAFRSKWGFSDRTGVWLMQLGFFSSNWRFSVRSGIKSKKKVNMLQKVKGNSVFWLSGRNDRRFGHLPIEQLFFRLN